MTDEQPGGARRYDPLAEPPAHGYRKLSSGVGMLLMGEVAGQDVIRFVWDAVAEVLVWVTSVPLEPMPESVATSIFGLFAAASWYKTEEK